MIIRENLDFKNFKDRKVNLSIGTYDALHKGHLKVLNTLVKESKKDNVLSAVFTFKNKPLNVLHNEKDGVINPVDRKIQILKESGINLLILINFTKKFAQISAEDFIKKLLSLFIINKVIVGEDFRFGNKHKGDVKFLKELSKVHHFKIKIIKNILYKNKKISTTMVKKYIKSGEVETIPHLLGRYYSITGKVIRGEGLGKRLGFPTANLRPEFKEQILPANGVYITKTHIAEKVYYSLTYIGEKNIGRKKDEFVIETYIHNFNRNIYNKKIEIFFIKRLRKEIKFSNIDALVKQMEKDKLKAILEAKKWH